MWKIAFKTNVRKIFKVRLRHFKILVCIGLRSYAQYMAYVTLDLSPDKNK